MPATLRLILLALLAFLPTLYGAPAVTGQPLWFNHVKTPASLDEKAGLTLVSELRAGLKAGKSPKELSRLVPEDNAPRAIFITLSDGIFPSRTYYYCDSNFRRTLNGLLEILQRREKEYIKTTNTALMAQVELARDEKRTLPEYVRTKLKHPGEWDSLQLDVVQSVTPAPGFVIASHQLLLANSIGIAFDPGFGFAFPPQQLTGRCLTTVTHQLSIPAVANLVSESGNWRALQNWIHLANQEAGIDATVFESDSYYADGEGACRLFRGHPVATAAPTITAESAAAQSRQAVKPLLRLLAGNLLAAKEVPFPEWFSGRDDGQISARDKAELILALCALADDPAINQQERKDMLEALRQATKALLEQVKRYDANEGRTSAQPEKRVKRRPANQRTYGCIVEDEELSPEAIEVPRQIAPIHSSAVALLAFCQVVQVLPENEKVVRQIRGMMPQFFRHIMHGVSRDGTIAAAMLYPETKPLLDYTMDALELADTMGMIGLIMIRCKEVFPDTQISFTQEQLLEWRGHALKRSLNAKGELPQSLWLARFLAQAPRPEAPEVQAALTRMALSATQGLELAPPVPDMYGAPKEIPSMTYAAERLAIIAVAASAIHRAGNPQDALGLLQDGWPLLPFMLQAQMHPATAASLPHPMLYLGLRRDNLADFGFTLDGQVTHIATLQQLSQTLRQMKLQELSPLPAQAQSWEKNWRKLQSHPVCLTPELVVRSTYTPPENARQLSGRTESQSVKTFQTKKGYRGAPLGNSERTSSRVLKRRKR